MSGKSKSSKTNGTTNLKDKLSDNRLDLSLCTLETVPLNEIVELNTKGQKIIELSLSYNKLTELTLDFATKLTFLRHIDLSKNKLTVLPKNFGLLVNLEYLDLYQNKLVDLPSSFCELKKLKWLDLKDNPDLKPEVRKRAGDCLDKKQCEKCAREVVLYMKDVAAAEERDRQKELKRKREEEQKQLELEKQKQRELKELKKVEREKRFQELQKRKEEKEKQEQIEIASSVKSTQSKPKSSTSSSSKSSFGFIFTILLLLVPLVVFYLLSDNYCNSSTRLGVFKQGGALHHTSLTPLYNAVQQHACPLAVQFKKQIDSYAKRYLNF